MIRRASSQLNVELCNRWYRRDGVMFVVFRIERGSLLRSVGLFFNVIFTLFQLNNTSYVD